MLLESVYEAHKGLLLWPQPARQIVPIDTHPNYFTASKEDLTVKKTANEEVYFESSI